MAKIEPLRIHGSCNIFYKKGSRAAYLKDLYEDNKAQQNEVIQLLSMFEVAFTPKQRKTICSIVYTTCLRIVTLIVMWNS